MVKPRLILEKEAMITVHTATGMQPVNLIRYSCSLQIAVFPITAQGTMTQILHAAWYSAIIVPVQRFMGTD